MCLHNISKLLTVARLHKILFRDDKTKFMCISCVFDCLMNTDIPMHGSTQLYFGLKYHQTKIHIFNTMGRN